MPSFETRSTPTERVSLQQLKAIESEIHATADVRSHKYAKDLVRQISALQNQGKNSTELIKELKELHQDVMEGGVSGVGTSEQPTPSDPEVDPRSLERLNTQLDRVLEKIENRREANNLTHDQLRLKKNTETRDAEYAKLYHRLAKLRQELNDAEVGKDVDDTHHKALRAEAAELLNTFRVRYKADTETQNTDMDAEAAAEKGESVPEDDAKASEVESESKSVGDGEKESATEVHAEATVNYDKYKSVRENDSVSAKGKEWWEEKVGQLDEVDIVRAFRVLQNNNELQNRDIFNPQLLTVINRQVTLESILDELSKVVNHEKNTLSVEPSKVAELENVSRLLNKFKDKISTLNDTEKETVRQKLKEATKLANQEDAEGNTQQESHSGDDVKAGTAPEGSGFGSENDNSGGGETGPESAEWNGRLSESVERSLELKNAWRDAREARMAAELKEAWWKVGYKKKLAGLDAAEQAARKAYLEDVVERLQKQKKEGDYRAAIVQRFALDVYKDRQNEELTKLPKEKRNIFNWLSSNFSSAAERVGGHYQKHKWGYRAGVVVVAGGAAGVATFATAGILPALLAGGSAAAWRAGRMATTMGVAAGASALAYNAKTDNVEAAKLDKELAIHNAVKSSELSLDEMLSQLDEVTGDTVESNRTLDRAERSRRRAAIASGAAAGLATSGAFGVYDAVTNVDGAVSGVEMDSDFKPDVNEDVPGIQSESGDFETGPEAEQDRTETPTDVAEASDPEAETESESTEQTPEIGSEAIPDIDLEKLVYTVQPGDQGVTYILQECYPDLFPPVGSSNWLPIYDAFKNNPALLAEANFPNADIDDIFPGDQYRAADTFRADVFAEYYLNHVADEATRAAYLEAHPELATAPASAPTSASDAVETATTAAPTESMSPQPRPETLGATENAPARSLYPEQNPTFGAETGQSVDEANQGLKNTESELVTESVSTKSPEAEAGFERVYKDASSEPTAPSSTTEPEPMWNQQTAAQEAVGGAQAQYTELSTELGDIFDVTDENLAAQIQNEVVGWAAMENTSDPDALQSRAVSLYLREMLASLATDADDVSAETIANTLRSPLWDKQVSSLNSLAEPGQWSAIREIQAQLNELGAQPFSSFQGTFGEFLEALFKSIDKNSESFTTGIERLRNN